MILGDSQATLKTFWGDSWWFLVICESVWNCFGAILSDSWWFVTHSENIFRAILSDFWQFLVILGDLQISLKIFWGNSHWFVNHSENIFGAILGDSQWFSVIHKSVWEWLLVILSDSQTTLKTCLGQFLVIHEPLWNDSGAICKPFLNDS